MPTAADVIEHLTEVDFPAHRDDLIEAATAKGAPLEVLHVLQALAPTRYDNLDQIARAAPTE